MLRCFLFLLLCSSLYAEEEIVVHLKTASSLKPLYLQVIDKDAELDPSYLQQCEKVLSFDLTHNGRTVVVSKGEKVAFEVKAEVSHKRLSTFVSTGENQLKRIESVALTGNLAEDRRTLHLVADTIYEGIFHKKGIATSRILYTVRKKTGAQSYDWSTDVWEADYDGYNARQITHSGKLCVTPAYVPSTRSFIYVNYLTGQPKIYLASLSDGTAKRLTLIKGNQLMPAFSRQKNLLCFVCDILGNPELFAAQFDAKTGVLGKPWQITSLPSGAQGSPTFSPDGLKIAFVSNKDGAARIYVADLPPAGSSAKDLKLTLISKQHRENTAPAWSPDGTKIAYSAKVEGTRQIWVYDLQTKKEMQVTRGGGDKENPSWAGNSEHIVYHSTFKNSSEICWINLNEKEMVTVTKGAGEKRFPSWEI